MIDSSPARARLHGKTALITAAAQGIGRACAELFAGEGAHVIATDIDAAALRDVIGCETRVIDVCDAAAIASLAASVERVDILFNCAGMVPAGTILDCDEAVWARTIDLNVTAMFRLTRAILPSMIERCTGSIINMASVASSIKGVSGRFAYGTTKAAVIGLTRSIATDFVAHGIRCNAICPGTIDTPSLQRRLHDTGDYDAAFKAFVARQPMKRLGTATEIAQLALYLASDAASFTTGTVQIIDGGWSN